MLSIKSLMSNCNLVFILSLLFLTPFIYSNLDGDGNKLELGNEVEFILNIRGTSGTCMSAENVKVLPKGTLKSPTLLPEVLDGKVVRPLRSVNPDQDQYAGLVQASSETGMLYFFK